MAAVEIGTLRLRGPPHLASRAAFRIEDACRTELADSRKLVLVRRMRPASRAVSGRPEERAGAIRLAYSAATADARHGRDAGDGAFVNCVWFESPAEARRLLLAELIAGRSPSGWFWRLAVPEWRGRPLETWLSEIVASVLRGGEEREALGLLLFALEQADIELVVRALRTGIAFVSPHLPAPVHPPPAHESGGEVVEAPGRDEPAAALREAAAGLRALLPVPLLNRIEHLARRLGPGQRPVLRLLERLLLQASPSLALAPAQLRALASAWSEQLTAPAPAPAPRPAKEAPLRRQPTLPTGALAPTSPASPTSLSVSFDDRPAGVPAVPPAEAGRRAPTLEPAIEGPLARRDGRRSEAAGLWLAVPSLIRLGFREWLGERPRLLREDAGRTLLRVLARHHRIADGDPALAAFEDLAEIGEIPDWAHCWRSGLDGWLRRRARTPLHRLVWKRGEVELAEDALTVRFPLAAADLRLRRRALDVDPGWVDWLGLSVRYRYEEEGR